jgi:hypothetical protein
MQERCRNEILDVCVVQIKILGRTRAQRQAGGQTGASALSCFKSVNGQENAMALLQ